MGLTTSKKISSHDKAVLDLKRQRDKLQQYRKRIEAVLDREKEIARIHLKNGDKNRALLALKKRKYQETLLEKTENQLLNVEQLTSSIEDAVVQKQVIEGLKKGTEVLNELNAEMDLNTVEKLMDDTADAIAYQRELEDLMHSLTKEDESAALEELEELEKQLAGKELDKISVPKEELPQVETPEEEEPVKQKPQKILAE